MSRATNQLMVGRAVRCKICGTPAQFISSIVDGERAGTDECYRCPSCGLVFVGNDPTQEELASAYAHVTEQYYSSIEAETRRKFAAATAELRRLGVSPDAKILDVGAGNGWFAEILSEAGFRRVAAHDLPGTDLSRLQQIGVQVFFDFDYLSLPTNTFDVVTLMDVAEHVPDPNYLFAQCHRMLTPGGMLYFHTPMVTPVDRLMHFAQRVPGIAIAGRIWQRGRLSVYHLQNYTIRSLQIALNRAGFGSIEIRRENELSWPIWRYVRVYVTRGRTLLRPFEPLAAALLYPLLATNLLNPNKAIVVARR